MNARELDKAKPGLAKTRGEREIHVRSATLVRGSWARWKELLAAADVVSEGAEQTDADGPAWFGSTSLLVVLAHSGEKERDFLASLALRDPHVRLLATRIARREASARASAPLGRASCEVRASADPRGLRIDVDLQAPLIVGARRGARSGRPKPGAT